MKFRDLPFFVLLALLAVLISPLPARAQSRIVGGVKAPDDAYPWIAALANHGSGSLFSRQYCGASLIAPDWVLTAAHCVEGESAGRLQVVVGLNTLDDTSGAVLRNVRGIFRHPNYDDLRGDLVNDVALLLLDAPVFSITPVAFSRTPTTTAGSPVRALGWGDTRADPRYPTELRMVDLNLVTIVSARKAYSTKVIDKRHVAAMASGKDTCAGDSGGPLFDIDGDFGNPLLLGVTSYGIDCAVPNVPGIYANVGHFAPWIDTILAEPLTDDPDLAVFGSGKPINAGRRSATVRDGTHFGRPIREGRTVTKRFALVNGSTGGPLAIDSINSTKREFRVISGPTYLLSSRASTVAVSFRGPTAFRRGLVKSRLIIRSSDPDTPSYTIPLLARYVGR